MKTLLWIVAAIAIAVGVVAAAVLIGTYEARGRLMSSTAEVFQFTLRAEYFVCVALFDRDQIPVRQ